MEEKYWRQFLSTGKVEDYLSYRAKNSETCEENRLKDSGADKRGSDRSDRDDTFKLPSG